MDSLLGDGAGDGRAVGLERRWHGADLNGLRRDADLHLLIEAAAVSGSDHDIGDGHRLEALALQRQSVTAGDQVTEGISTTRVGRERARLLSSRAGQLDRHPCNGGSSTVTNIAQNIRAAGGLRWGMAGCDGKENDSEPGSDSGCKEALLETPNLLDGDDTFFFKLDCLLHGGLQRVADSGSTRYVEAAQSYAG